MAEEKKMQLHLVDLAGIGNLFEDLIVKDSIICEERDRIIQRIVADNDFPDHKLSILAEYQRSKDQVLEGKYITALIRNTSIGPLPIQRPARDMLCVTSRLSGFSMIRSVKEVIRAKRHRLQTADRLTDQANRQEAQMQCKVPCHSEDWDKGPYDIDAVHCFLLLTLLWNNYVKLRCTN